MIYNIDVMFKNFIKTYSSKICFDKCYHHLRLMKNGLCFFLLFFVATASAKVEVGDLRAEHMTNPLGLQTAAPRLSWVITSDKKDVVQTSYHILVASTKELLNRGEGDLWDSGDVASSEQLWITYGGRAMKSNERAFWKVRVTTNKGKSDWSEPAMWSVGLQSEAKWRGRWIGLEQMLDGENAGTFSRLAARYLRKEIEIKKSVVRATAYVAGIGLYEFHVNGKVVGDQVLAPSPTDYRKSIIYNTFDITDLLAPKTCIGIVLGNGRVFPMRQEKPYKVSVFGFPKCRINIIIEYADGTQETIATDDKWKVTGLGPIRANNEYDGEEYDARMELGDWDKIGYADSTWMKAQRTAIPEGELRGLTTPNMKESDAMKPTKITRLGDKYIIDFGQNIAGWAAAKMNGRSGDTIRIRYAEKLNDDGSLYRNNLRRARSEDIYVCNGRENGRWHKPLFSYHGFRYIEVSGLKNATADDFRAYVVADEMASIGTFECSDTILNKIIKNAWWGIKDNYKGMPVDCPQRDERQPWLGDRTVGSLGESFMFDNAALYAKWMRDICEAQRSDGCIPDIAPAFWNYYSDNVTWPAALPFSCDMLYEQFGNDAPLRDSYPYIKKWVKHLVEEYSKDGIITKDTYGDWCVPPENLKIIRSNDPTRKTNGGLLSTAYTIRILQLLEKFANLQGLNDEAQQFKQQREEMKDAFNKKFLVCKRGTSVRPGHALYPDSIFYGNNTATANLLALSFGIVPDSLREEVTKNVVQNIITKYNGHVSCGVIGISWLLRGLSDNGFADVAYLLATNKSYPSWGYMTENGATTIWELWNGDKANPSMNSGNHVMLLGDLLTWCWQYLGGIRQDQPAYKHIILKPSFEIQDCFNASVSYVSPYGKIVSNWKKTLQHLEWDVEIPCNTTADVCLPSGEVKRLGSGKYHFSAEIPTANAAIVKDEFLYEQASFPQCHASTITELKNGDLVAAYFGGKHENNPDVCIWVSRKPKGSDTWSEPILAADGVFDLGSDYARIAGVNDSTTAAEVGPIKSSRQAANVKNCRRKSCWNPVLFEMPDGELWLFYKIGLKVADWTGWMARSKDGGKTWSDKEALPEGFLGPVKNKPELIGDRLLCGSSTEVGGWRLHFEIYDLKTKQWKYVGPITSNDAPTTEDPSVIKPINVIQPSILKLKDGRLKVLCRSRNGKLAQSYSSDGGETWTNVTLSDVPNNQSGTDAVTLKDGRHALIYNDFETVSGTKKGPRTPLSIALSDDGETWRHVLTLEDSPISQYSYPAIIQGKDGTLHCVYTWRRQKVAYKNIDLKKLK